MKEGLVARGQEELVEEPPLLGSRVVRTSGDELFHEHLDLVTRQVEFVDEGLADLVIVADNNAGEDDIVECIGDVTDGDHDEGVDEPCQ